MLTFKAALLAAILVRSGAGASVYSMELLPSCGTAPGEPQCELRRVCSLPGPLCAAPRWDRYRRGWVRVESREAAAARIERVVESLTEQAAILDPSGGRELSLLGAAIALHESSFREDVEIGAPPRGRGPAGEVCLMQIMPSQVAKFAPWLSDDERPKTRIQQQRVARTLLGSDDVALGRCFAVGLKLAQLAQGQCRKQGDAGTFAAYGTGGKCRASAAAWVQMRVSTLQSLRRATAGAK